MGKATETVTVSGHFRNLDLTLVEFCERWTSHVKELRKLSYAPAWQNQVDSMIEKTRAEACREFNRILQRQRGGNDESTN